MPTVDYTDFYGDKFTFDMLHSYEAKLDDDLFLLLVNSTEQTMNVNISGFPGTFTVDDLFAGTSMLVDATELSWQLDVLGASMLKFHDFVVPEPVIIEPEPTTTVRRGRRRIPEPSSLVLVGLALAGLACCNRWRSL